MTFQVVNGSIPASVERWLRDEAGLRVERVGGRWVLIRVDWELIDWPLTWHLDRAPTLQEAIEAVMFAAS